MTAETDLLPLPWIERYAVVGDIAYPVSSDPDGDYVAHDDHAAAMQAYARACVSSATEALRAKAAEHRDGRLAALERAERLAEALRYVLRQNEHDMVLTGDEIRDIRARIEKEAGRG